MFLGSEAFPENPEKVYEKWAAMAKKWNCCGYEQDWLDTQYKRIKALRSDPHMAERWIFGMFDAMEKIYEAVEPFQFSNSILPNFRRKQDVARRQIEQARSEILYSKR